MSEMQTPDATRIDEIADGLFRIHTPLSVVPGGFSFNQYLVRDDDALLFHTGPRVLFPQVRDAIASVMPLAQLRYIGFSHVESDECGSLNQFLEAAPNAVPLCGRIAAMTSVHDLSDRPPKVLADGESVQLGRYSARWLDAPHVPHGSERGTVTEIFPPRTAVSNDISTAYSTFCPRWEAWARPVPPRLRPNGDA